MRQLMKSLIRCSEKAACIARACRNEKDLFQLLVEVSLQITILENICTFMYSSLFRAVVRYSSPRGGGASSAMASMICPPPLVGIGLTEPPNCGKPNSIPNISA